MGWAEFVLRSEGYKEDVENEQRLFRKVAYEIHTIGYSFSKKNPPTIQKYWKIGTEKAKQVPNSFIEAMRKARKDFKDKLNV